MKNRIKKKSLLVVSNTEHLRVWLQGPKQQRTLWVTGRERERRNLRGTERDRGWRCFLLLFSFTHHCQLHPHIHGFAHRHPITFSNPMLPFLVSLCFCPVPCLTYSHTHLSKYTAMNNEDDIHTQNKRPVCWLCCLLVFLHFSSGVFARLSPLFLSVHLSSVFSSPVVSFIIFFTSQ